MKKLSASRLFRGLALAALVALPGIAFAQTFQPLTSIPGIAQAAASPDLPAFLNNLYKVCIGASAVLAVLKIIQGGVTYMLGDSVTEKRDARHHIAMAVFGLVLVLSPAIVFGIIDPRILNLEVNTSQLAPTGSPASSQTAGTQQPGTGWTSTDANAAQTCTSQGGSPTTANGSTTCYPASSRTDAFPVGQTGINLNDVQACTKQTGCTVITHTRGQYTCQCVAPGG